MSTGGKVLTFLIIPVILAWMILASGVATINADAADTIRKLKTEITESEQQLAANEAEIFKTRDSIVLVQDDTAVNQAVLRERVNELERMRADKEEDKTRVSQQRDMLTASVEGANTSLNERKKELQDETQALAQLEGQVRQLQSDNAELTDQLTKLRDDFKRILQGNQRTVNSMVGGPHARMGSPVSYVPSGR
jgi:chromosome segregation ATPase